MRKTVAIILSIAILCSLFVVVFAVGNSNNRSVGSVCGYGEGVIIAGVGQTPVSK